MNTFSAQEIAKKIQHTNVNPDITRDDIKDLCNDCLEYGFDGVMLQPCWIEDAKKHLQGSDVKICTALGYPMGGAPTSSKAQEMRDVIALGAEQVDFMANIGFLKSGMYEEYHNEIAEIVKAADGRVTKIMLEFGMLTEKEKVKAAELALSAGVTYLKNSSGWGKGGHATMEDIKLLKRIAGDKALVKASGGIRDMEKATAILNAGASLLGTSAGVKIVTGSGEALTDY
ncbi:deoxyribose-phosphate aldolase [Virgibacillus halodenitrificans]|uniref:deoxyribose-phosphate aldolase n=1 Tax=Virgibacillus halodenitrificans TaxID=1482 RepID=UPI0013685098|nr:deoxyribose-phosphate aldolase [Virgibacillus halodenitrificans]MYL47113.1 deoxyribose-phosphate aldolase [Virgibacillus halodenitrificans]WHX26222.1 deoxyribose-phosphate aldolase [Virgibacillus halodenitrificans]